MPVTTNRRLAELLGPLIAESGISPSPLPGVDLMRGTETLQRHPIIYTPRIIIIAQGQKRVYLGDESYVYDANNYLVLPVPMVFECETTASPEEPLLGMSIDIDPILVGDLLLELGDLAAGQPTSCVSSARADAGVIEAAERLAQALSSPSDCRILGPQLVREIVYRVLTGDQGEVLRLATSQASRIGQMARVLRRIHRDYASDLDVASLAREANMGTSAFHEAFRQATATSPLQYVKRVRLHRARGMLRTEGVSVGEAARRVGYASGSQFSREYRRMFGCSPSEDRAAVGS